MAEGARLRRIAEPVVAAPPAGVRVRTRLQVSAAEAAALSAIGVFLGSVYRGELAGRIGCGCWAATAGRPGEPSVSRRSLRCRHRGGPE